MANPNYYGGSQEKAQASDVTRRKLEKRAKLTPRSNKLIIVMVGLPGRGKSFISRKLMAYFTWRGAIAEVFNVGRYRRQFTAQQRKEDGQAKLRGATSISGGASASFFDPNNENASKLREEVALFALNKLLGWLNDKVDDGEQVAIFDATNSTKARRDSILRLISNHQLHKGGQVGVMFLESVCDDEELLEENFKQKVAHSPDFAGMTQEDAIADLRERVKRYEAAYETIEDDDISYIKVFNLSSKLLANQIYGRLSKSIVPALMMWHVGSRPIWFCRAGQTTSEETRLQTAISSLSLNSVESVSKEGSTRSNEFSRFTRGDTLGKKGLEFRDNLSRFVRDKGAQFMSDRSNKDYEPRLHTGTSVKLDTDSIRKLFENDPGTDDSSNDDDSDLQDDMIPSFPCKVMCSTMPRAIGTATWPSFLFRVEQYSNLNPLDKGDFSGLELEEIMSIHPQWYTELESDPYKTRFPGGESYHDLVNRLESSLIDMEQQVSPVLVVSHVSVIQCLLAYFRNTPVQKCTSIEVPLHTVIEMSPMKGAGWHETHYPLCDVAEDCPPPVDDQLPPSPRPTPIWGDHSLHGRNLAGVSPPPSDSSSRKHFNSPKNLSNG